MVRRDRYRIISRIRNVEIQETYIYNEVPIKTPPMVIVKSVLNSEQVSLMRPIYIEKKNVLLNKWS